MMDAQSENAAHVPARERSGAVLIAGDVPSMASRAAADQLRSIIERVERMEEEKKSIADDIKDIYAEAKANGFDVKTLRTVVRLRKQDASERAEQDAILETYLHALGMV